MKVTEKQMNGLVTHQSPYVRAIGFLYLRYCHPPANLWDWFSESLDDQELVRVTPKIEKSSTTTFKTVADTVPSGKNEQEESEKIKQLRSLYGASSNQVSLDDVFNFITERS
eukprot:gene7465-8734_t